MDMGITQIGPGVVAVTLDGRLDPAGAESIDEQFNTVAGDNRCMLVDLAAVSFMSSIGVRTLLTGSRIVLRRGGRFALINPTDGVERVLTVSGVTSMMPIFRSRADALAAFTPAS